MLRLGISFFTFRGYLVLRLRVSFFLFWGFYSVTFGG